MTCKKPYVQGNIMLDQSNKNRFLSAVRKYSTDEKTVPDLIYWSYVYDRLLFKGEKKIHRILEDTSFADCKDFVFLKKVLDDAGNLKSLSKQM